jgi:F-type H+-transporting ATPase subunit b
MTNHLETPEFWVAVGFLVLMVVLYRPALRFILAGLDGRADKIRSDLEEAQKLKDEAQHLLADYQRKQRDAAKEIEGLIAAARKEADALQKRAKEQIEASLERRERLADEKISQAEADAVATVRNAAVDIAISATAKLLGEGLEEQEANRLIDSAITELPQKLQ